MQYAVGQRNQLLFEQAHKYRLHQDILRWTLLAGYAAFFTATISLLTSATLSQRQNLHLLVSFALTGIGTAYFAVLAVENWYYNVFAGYTRDCEDRFVKNLELQTMEQFAELTAPTVSSFHLSFWFAEVIVIAGNSVYLTTLTGAAYDWLRIGFQEKWVVVLAVWLPYVFVCHLLVKYSNGNLLKAMLARFQDLYTPRG